MDFTQLQSELQTLLNMPVNLTPEAMGSVLLGIGLSASCGFRIFIPPLVLAIASSYFGVKLPPDLHWITSTPAVITLSIAAVMEVGAYYIPWLDNLLDHLSAPLAVVAGTLLTGSFLGGHLPPWLQWSVALIAGGGAAGGIQGLTSLGRLSSLAATAGFANPVIATAENALAVGGSVLAVTTPVLFILLLIVGVIVLINIGKTLFKNTTSALTNETTKTSTLES